MLEQELVQDLDSLQRVFEFEQPLFCRERHRKNFSQPGADPGAGVEEKRRGHDFIAVFRDDPLQQFGAGGVPRGQW